IRHNMSADFRLSLFLSAFEQAENRSLTATTASNDSSSSFLVHIPSQPADVGFVHLDSLALAAHLFEAALRHGEPQPVHHEPCGLLGNPKSAVYLVGTDSVLRSGNQPHSGKPFIQWDRGILE